MVYSEGKHKAVIQSSGNRCILSWVRTLFRIINQGGRAGILQGVNGYVVPDDKIMN